MSTPSRRRPTLLLPLALLAGVALTLQACEGAEETDQESPLDITVNEVTHDELRQPGAVVVDTVGDRYIVSNLDGVPADEDGTGHLSVVSPEGEVVEPRWVDLAGTDRAMDSPGGMAIRGDSLFVADMECIRIFHRETGEDLGFSCLEDVSWITDVDVGPEGSIFVTDAGFELADGELASTGTDAVYRIVLEEGRQGATLARGDDLGRPYGIAVGRRGIFVTTAESGEVYRLTPQGDRTEIFPVSDRRFGGIAFLPDGGFVFSSWTDEVIFLVTGEGRVARLMEGIPEAGGLAFDPARNRIVIPLLGENRILLVDLPDDVDVE